MLLPNYVHVQPVHFNSVRLGICDRDLYLTHIFKISIMDYRLYVIIKIISTIKSVILNNNSPPQTPN